MQSRLQCNFAPWIRKYISKKFKMQKSVCCTLLPISLLLLWYLSPYLKTSSMNTIYTSEIKNRGDKYHLCAPSFGRLGNNMFQYAAAYGIASEKGMKVLLAPDSLIAMFFSVDADIFENASQICSTFPLYHEYFWGIYNRSFSVGIHKKQSIRLYGYFQSYKYFSHVREEIKRQFMSFSEQTRKTAIDILKKIKQDFLVKFSVTSVTLVGIHVRRGDKLNVANVRVGNKVALIEYFIKAIAYFTSKYENIVFVVCGDDQKWPNETVPLHNNAVFLNQSSTPDVDLAILSMCDHMLLSTGSYGWWAAYLNRGEVVYYKDWITLESEMWKAYEHDDYFPPAWIPM